MPEQGQGEAFPLPGYTGMECLVKGVAFRDTLAGLKGGSPHLGAGAKHPCAGQGEGPCPVSDGLPSLGTGYYLPTLPYYPEKYMQD